MGDGLPTVSVLVPCYSAERYLRQALDSVAAQTVAPLECIVVDDGSTDRSAWIAAEYEAPFRLIRQVNQGRAAAMNRAIGEAVGDVVMFLDADDYWLPGMIAAQVGTMVETGADMVYAHPVRCDEEGEDLPTRFPDPVPERCLAELMHSNRLNGCGACVRTEVLRKVGGFDGCFWPADDYHLWLRIAVEHRIVKQPEPLGRYRYYCGQASAARLGMTLVELGAKLDLLARHPQVRRQLGAALVKEAVEDRFFATMQRWQAAGQQGAARRLARTYLRHWPWRLRGWRYALVGYLPWRVYARTVAAMGRTGGQSGGIARARSAPRG
ncbi:MAG TPA: glycosyltransferase family 2 protein [Phycisphaerae bacterium]|nr:glycosyltransferase family 2 protein [Phycisphaerae bacterium]